LTRTVADILQRYRELAQQMGNTNILTTVWRELMEFGQYDTEVMTKKDLRPAGLSWRVLLVSTNPGVGTP